MARGGIFDQFGGGFARYSTDREWLAPHFEKTLYDNALLALCYTEAWQDGHMALYRDVAERTLDYCLRELRDEQGGFYAGQDADSEGEEGAYYLFTPAEVKAVLGESEGRGFCECYDITEEGNFHGKSIPNLLLNQRWNLVPEGYGDTGKSLRLYRAGRCPLGTDRKLLTGWNGLMLLALAKAASGVFDSRAISAAEDLADFLARELGDRAPKRSWCEGEARFAARLDDYAFYALGLLELYRAGLRPAHIAAREGPGRGDPRPLCRSLGRLFPDGLGRREADPAPEGDAGRGAALRQQRRGRAVSAGAESGRELAEKQADFLASAAGQYPAALSFGMLPLLLRERGSREIVRVLPEEKLPASLETVLCRYAPELSLLLKSPARAETLARIAPFTASMEPKDGRPTYYVCTGGACGLPVNMEGDA